MMLDENVMRGKAVDFTETTMSPSIKKQERSQQFQQPEIVLLQTQQQINLSRNITLSLKCEI